jgi:hypothetical protein
MNMIQPKSDQDRFTAERVLRTRPKTYRIIVQLLADPGVKIEHIAQQQRVSTHTVRAIRQREAVAIAERKQRLTSIFANVAEIAAERMEELAGQASLRDAGTTAGIATDKLLALSSDGSITIHHEHTHSHQHELVAALNAAVEQIEKRAKAAVVEVPALPTARRVTTARKRRAKRELNLRTNSDTRTA